MYAELLLNIRQVTIIAALQTPCDPTTKAELSAHGQQIILQHDGDTTTFTLPGQVAPHTRLQKPAIGSKELSWRLPLVDTPMRVVVENAQSNEAPWSARSLEEGAEFKCRECGAVIIENGTIKAWKDLPSENWAEMMEFWHCHKPADHVEEGAKGHAEHNVVAATKDYGANTRFAAQSEVGFVNLTTFLLANTDCSNVEVRHLFISHDLLFFPSRFEDGGRQEGDQAQLLLPNGLVTDTNAQDKYLVTLLLLQQLTLIPSSLDYGFLV